MHYTAAIRPTTQNKQNPEPTKQNPEPRVRHDEEQKRSYLNTWATAASKKLQYARRLATKDSKQRFGAWAAPLDSVLRTYGAE